MALGVGRCMTADFRFPENHLGRQRPQQGLASILWGRLYLACVSPFISKPVNMSSP